MDLVGEDPEGQRPAAVEERRFDEPRRLSPQTLEELQRRLADALPTAEAFLEGVLQESHALSLTELREASACGLFREPRAGQVIGVFRIGEQAGCVFWDAPAAVAAVERVLGSQPSATDRPLSGIERDILLQLFTGICTAVGQALSLQIEALRVVPDPDELRSWDSAEASDYHRLSLVLGIEGPDGQSAVSLYLPGMSDGGEGAGLEETPSILSSHMERVPVDLEAVLGATEIRLSELLSLQEGDVLALDEHAGTPIQVHIDGRPRLRAHLGTSRGQLALRILRVEDADEQREPS